MRSAVRSALVAAGFLSATILVAVSVLRSPAPAAEPPATATASVTVPSAPRTVEGMRIRVPRLGIDLPLREGDAGRDIPSESSPGATPEGAAFHFPGTAVPGSRGNAYLYAHARVGMFLALWQAQVGDRVELILPGGGVLAYSVAEVHPQVPSSDTSWLQPTSDERLTLQTSTGPTPAHPRFIVVARRDLPS